jgi:hypothetical protein
VYSSFKEDPYAPSPPIKMSGMSRPRVSPSERISKFGGLAIDRPFNLKQLIDYHLMAGCPWQILAPSGSLDASIIDIL